MDNLSIRFALRKIAEITCDTAPSLIRVSARLENSRRTYGAAIPWEYRAEICAFLRQKLGFELRMDGSVLILTEEKARAVLELTYRSDVEKVGARITEAPDMS